MLTLSTSIKYQYNKIFLAPDCFDYDRDYEGNDINSDPNDKDYGAGAGRRNSARQCQILCQSRTECNFFTYRPSVRSCWLKNLDSGRRYETGAISGTKFCGIWMY